MVTTPPPPSPAVPFVLPVRPPGSRERVVSRVIDAARERVFRAWTQELPAWWGPHSMTTPECTLELRPGGVFRTVVRDLYGMEEVSEGVFLEVQAPERIVFTDAYRTGWTPAPEASLTVVATFEALPGDRTRYTLRIRRWPATSADPSEARGFLRGWDEGLESLAALATHS